MLLVTSYLNAITMVLSIMYPLFKIFVQALELSLFVFQERGLVQQRAICARRLNAPAVSDDSTKINVWFDERGGITRLF